jgi:hypothetical protein
MNGGSNSLDGFGDCPGRGVNTDTFSDIASIFAIQVTPGEGGVANRQQAGGAGGVVLAGFADHRQGVCGKGFGAGGGCAPVNVRGFAGYSGVVVVEWDT